MCVANMLDLDEPHSSCEVDGVKMAAHARWRTVDVFMKVLTVRKRHNWLDLFSRAAELVS